MRLASRYSGAELFVYVSLLAMCTNLSVLGNRLAADEEDGHEHTVEKVPEEVTYRPTANPDRIILTWVGDPSISQAVTWRTDTSVARALAQFTLADDGPKFASAAREVTASTQPFTSDLGCAHYHSVNMDGLSPKTKYVYRVGDGTNWSEWIHFTTASDKPEPFLFVYFGDAQNDLKSHWSRVVREAYSDAPKAAFMLHAGDLVNQANRDAEWGEWFYASGFIHRMVPCIATPGNHEYFKEKCGSEEDSEEPRKLSRHWRPTFAFPENGPRDFEESVYWIDYQGVRIVSLNSNEDHKSQVQWLECVLEENPNSWTIVTFHHPIYSSKEGRDNPEQRALWQPVFDRHRVDLVLQGHDHTYARSQLMAFENLPTGVATRSAEAGTLYVVSVSGPKMYELGRRPFMRRAAENTQLYQIIAVNGDQLRYEARTATGQLYDAFTLKKRPGQVNQLIDQAPDTPERRRPVEELTD